ncbi:MAG TPA: WD40 repeat domain-containing protein, partial [Gemmataceae bacterium]
ESLSFHPDGDNLIAATRHNTLIWLNEERIRRAPEYRANQVEHREGWLGPVVYSPSGKLLAGAEGQENLVLRDSAQPWRRRAMGKCAEVKQILFSPDGRRLATRERDATVRLWDVAGRKMLFALVAKDKAVCTMVFSRDGKQLLTGGGTRAKAEAPSSPWKEAAIRVWDAATGAQVRVLKHPRLRAGVSSLALSPNGRTLAVASAGEVYLWDMKEGKPRRALARVGDGGEAIGLLQFSPDGEQLAGAAGNVVCLWHTASGRLFTPGPRETADALTAAITAVAASADGRLLATGGKDGRIDVWNLPARRLLRRLSGHAEAVAQLTFSPDGKTLASRSRSGVIRLWDPTSGRQRREIPSPPAHDTRTICLAYSPDGQTLVADYRAADGKAFGIALWDAKSGREIQNLKNTPGGGGLISALAFSANGERLQAVRRTGALQCWRAENGRFRVEEGPPPAAGDDSSPVALSAAFSSDGVLAIVDSGRQKIRVQEPSVAGRPRILPERVTAIQQLAFSPDGRYLLGNEAGDVFRVYEMASGQEVLMRRLPAPAKAGPFTFTADSRHIVSGMANATLLVWDVFTPTGIRGGRPARLWNDLKDEFAAWAHQAMSGMIAAGDETVAFLEHNLSTVEEPKAEQVTRWIAELDSDEFRVRERATKQLAKAGEAARAALERAHAGKPSLEVRRRIESLLAHFPNGFVADGETLRRRRAVAVLEHIGTPAARRLLRRLSEGADTSLTREAKKALTRLSE